MPFAHGITDVDGLLARYGRQSEIVRRKQIDRVDASAMAFIAAAPFVVVATAGPRGGDASPRGGPAGFVAVLDEHRLAIGDLSGNNRLDTARNVIDHPAIGLLFIVPGVDETLRVNGRATLTTDAAVLDATTVAGRRPTVALGIDVEECFVHCAKAFRRAALWDPASWLPPDERPSAARILRAHAGLDAGVDAVADYLESDYRTSLWAPGGAGAGGAATEPATRTTGQRGGPAVPERP